MANYLDHLEDWQPDPVGSPERHLLWLKMVDVVRGAEEWERAMTILGLGTEEDMTEELARRMVELHTALADLRKEVESL